MNQEDQYNINLIVGPSGVGKRTIIKKLRDKIEFQHIIPVSTDSFFSKGKNLLSQDKFRELLEKKSFYTSFFKNGNYYGVLKEQIEKAISSNLPVVWKISSPNAQKIKTIYPFVKIIYITAPLKTLRERLVVMGIKSDNVITERLIRAKKIMDSASFRADCIIGNEQDKIDKTVADLINVIQNKKN